MNTPRKDEGFDEMSPPPWWLLTDAEVKEAEVGLTRILDWLANSPTGTPEDITSLQRAIEVLQQASRR